MLSVIQLELFYYSLLVVSSAKRTGTIFYATATSDFLLCFDR